MKKRLVCILFSLMFFAGCLTPLVGLAVTGGAKAGANEVLAVRPSLKNRDGTLNGDFLSGLADYVNDRFYLRQECVTAWARLNAALLRTSVTEDVLLGGDGWLYYAPTLDDYTGAAPMTDRELWCAARTLFLLQEAVERRDGRFLFTVAPNKNSLYDDAMPAYPRASSPTNAESLAALLADMGVNYVNLFKAFRGQSETLYFPTDSHWNGKGAALAADSLLAALGRDGAFFSGPFAAGEHRGDLYEMLCPAGRDLDADQVYAPGFGFTADTANANSITIRTQGGGEGALLMYRDSFGRNLYPFMAQAFSEAVFSRKTDFDPSPMADGGVMIVELVERNLRYLNTYPPTLPAAERDAALIEGAVPAGRIQAERRAAADGSVSLRGTFTDVLPDDDSPVWILADGAVYEAVPLPDGFSVTMPEGFSTLSAVFFSGGSPVLLNCIM